MATGKVDPDALGPELGELDERIIKLAGRRLGGSLKTTFFYAYACKRDWKEIEVLFLKEFGKKLAPETVKRYGDRAVLALTSAAKNAEEFR